MAPYPQSDLCEIKIAVFRDHQGQEVAALLVACETSKRAVERISQLALFCGQRLPIRLFATGGGQRSGAERGIVGAWRRLLAPGYRFSILDSGYRLSPLVSR